MDAGENLLERPWESIIIVLSMLLLFFIPWASAAGHSHLQDSGLTGDLISSGLTSCITQAPAMELSLFTWSGSTVASPTKLLKSQAIQH